MKLSQAQLLSMDSSENYPSKSINEWDLSEIPEKFRKEKFYFYFRGRRTWMMCMCKKYWLIDWQWNKRRKKQNHKHKLIHVTWTAKFPARWFKIGTYKVFSDVQSWITCDWTIVNVMVLFSLNSSSHLIPFLHSTFVNSVNARRVNLTFCWLRKDAADEKDSFETFYFT